MTNILDNNKKFHIAFNIKPNVVNVNNIMFTSESIDRAVEEYNNKDSKTKIGTMEYSNDYIQLDKAAFVLEDIEKDSSNGYVGRISVLDTDEGNKLIKKITDGQNISIGIHATSVSQHINEQGTTVVDDMNINYVIIMDKERFA